MELNLVKEAPTRKTIKKRIDITDAEPMGTRETKVIGKIKGGYCCRIYVGKTRAILEILHQYKLVQGLMGVVILQADDSVGAINLEAQQKASGKCEFDKYLEGMHL